MKLQLSLFALLASVVLFLTFFVPTVSANHAWGSYHWARTNNPFTLKLGDNLTSNWDPYLATTSTDWSVSDVLDTAVVAGNTSGRRCRPTSGRVEVCNSTYGKNGWLGIAQIWVSGNHITQGITKLNDTYFNSAYYNTPAWKNLVMCQELGHNFGLDHQDEIFDNANLNTCMDYTSNPASNQHPNAHDYEELGIIYAHLDSFTTVQSGAQKLPFGQAIAEGAKNGDMESRSDWGKELKNNGHVAVYERDFGMGQKVFTFTIWAE